MTLLELGQMIWKRSKVGWLMVVQLDSWLPFIAREWRVQNWKCNLLCEVGRSLMVQKRWQECKKAWNFNTDHALHSAFNASKLHMLADVLFIISISMCSCISICSIIGWVVGCTQVGHIVQLYNLVISYYIYIYLPQVIRTYI